MALSVLFVVGRLPEEAMEQAEGNGKGFYSGLGGEARRDGSDLGTRIFCLVCELRSRWLVWLLVWLVGATGGQAGP